MTDKYWLSESLARQKRDRQITVSWVNGTVTQSILNGFGETVFTKTSPASQEEWNHLLKRVRQEDDIKNILPEELFKL